MTIQQARRLCVGDGVIYNEVLRGIVTAIKLNSAVIQFGKRVLDIPHDQMTLIERTKKDGTKTI
jgi:hypothetical protein